MLKIYISVMPASALNAGIMTSVFAFGDWITGHQNDLWLVAIVAFGASVSAFAVGERVKP